MLVGRTTELKYLNDYYYRGGSQQLIIYGQKYIGKTSLIREFAKDKPCHYYMARACSEKEHMLALEQLMQKVEQDYSEQKVIIVIDEFQNAVRSCETFIDRLFSLKEHLEPEKTILTILVSSRIDWVENRMIAAIGKAAQDISDVFKLKELDFKYVKEYFSWYTVRQCIEVYSILGGVPGWWQYFNAKQSLKDNVCHQMLAEKGFLYTAAESLMTEQLREPAVYNTLLAALASGKQKLNDLYHTTGFSRAKISVYLGQLIEMDLVEKVFSLEDGRTDTRKGLYRIKNHYFRFYFSFLYHAGETLFYMTPERYYNRYIFPKLEEYTEVCFTEICKQHFEECKNNESLPISVAKIGSWFGKDGTIDIMAKDEQGKTILALCRGKRLGMLTQDYRKLLENIKRAKIEADYIWLYADRFEEEIVYEAQRKDNITLIDTRTL